MFSSVIATNDEVNHILTKTFSPASSLSLLAFVCILVTVVFAKCLGVYVTHRRIGRDAVRKVTYFGMAYALFFLIYTAVILSGAIATSPVPWLMITFGVVNFTAVLFAMSKMGGTLSKGLTSSELIAFQVFRIPLELILHSWAQQGTIPSSMTWDGQNIDIISGFVALISFPFANRYRQVAWGANIVGLLLLLNVMRVAILSSPVPFGWDIQPPLQLAFHLPYAYIVPVCVAGALAAHLILARRLLGLGR